MTRIFWAQRHVLQPSLQIIRNYTQLRYHKVHDENPSTPLRSRSHRFQCLNTVLVRPVITLVIKTIEPRNIQALFASNCESFSNGLLRHFPISPLVGDGVIALDGLKHERDRAMIRPTFSKALIGDEKVYGTHVGNLMKLLPTDGSTVDLQPLVERLDVDASTEFKFGESVAFSALIDLNSFPAAFARAQE